MGKFSGTCMNPGKCREGRMWNNKKLRNPFTSLTSWKRVLLKKLIVDHLFKKSSHFTDSEISLPSSQEPATGPY
jgi:hypothetical protein